MGSEADDGLISEDCQIDPIISPKDMLHIMDSDVFSQTLAIHEVRKGKILLFRDLPALGNHKRLPTSSRQPLLMVKVYCLLLKKWQH